MDASEKKFADSVARSWRASPDTQQWLVLSDLFEQEGDMESAQLWRDRAAVFVMVRTRLRVVLKGCEASSRCQVIEQIGRVTFRQGSSCETIYRVEFRSSDKRMTVSFQEFGFHAVRQTHYYGGFFYKETLAKGKTNEQHLSERLVEITERIIHADREILRLYREGAIQ